MIAARRTAHNAALEYAVDEARRLQRPLVVLEGLRCGHRWASPRFHQFVLDGMRDNAAAFEGTGVTYFPYLESTPGDGKGLLAHLAAQACLVVTDEFPSFFLPRMVAAAGRQLPVSLIAVDSNGLLPLRATDTTYPTAYAFRRMLQQRLPAHLPETPSANPLEGDRLPQAPPLASLTTARWPDAWSWLASTPGGLSALPLDHAVGVAPVPGGPRAARARLDAFIARDLDRYSERSHPDEDVASGLSPYLHWGHISAHEVFARVMQHAGWLGHLPAKATGSREGWWGVGPAIEGFLDELITWRELGYNMSWHRADAESFDALPGWAQATLDKHADDPRQHRYDLDAFAAAATHDPVWNAAQRQLVHEGRMHNYLRMLWGKKILEWTASPRAAADVMIELNNRYALDGRNPNSYSGIFWVLGRYDRPWAPERPIFGVIRYMSSDNTVRKLRLRQYLARWSADATGQPGLPGFGGR